MANKNASVSPDPRQTADELSTLKQRADLMGIKYHHKIGAKRLAGMIDNVLNPPEVTQTEEDINKSISASRDKEFMFKPGKGDPELKPATRKEIVAHRKREAGKLIRIRLTCMNPAKREWPGEIISVGSAKIGTFKKFIPFNVDAFHIPFIIYEFLLERKFTVFYTVKSDRGIEIKRAKLSPEFAIQVLEPLTQKERIELANEQARTRRLEGE